MPASQYEKIALQLFRSRGLPLISYNKRVAGLKYRPDFVFMQGSNIVVVECDERQHELYDKVKEEKRENTILQRYRDMGYSPILIRYDPAPERQRSCVRAAYVTDIVWRTLHNMDLTHTLLQKSTQIRGDKIVLY